MGESRSILHSASAETERAESQAETPGTKAEGHHDTVYGRKARRKGRDCTIAGTEARAEGRDGAESTDAEGRDATQTPGSDAERRTELCPNGQCHKGGDQRHCQYHHDFPQHASIYLLNSPLCPERSLRLPEK